MFIFPNMFSLVDNVIKDNETVILTTPLLIYLGKLPWSILMIVSLSLESER